MDQFFIPLSPSTHTHTLLTGYLSWSRNAAICAGIAATVRIFEARGMDSVPAVGSDSLITGMLINYYTMVTVLTTDDVVST